MQMQKRYDGYAGILMPTGFAKIRSTDFTSPLGQNILATYLADRIPRFQAMVFDGERTSTDEIMRLASSMSGRILVGFSLLSGNSSVSFALARQFHEKGFDVAIGGPLVSAYGAKAVMSKGNEAGSGNGKNGEGKEWEERDFIKYGITGSGEQTLLQLVRGAELNAIPNLAYREGEEVHVNPYNSALAENLDWGGIRVDYSLLHDISKGKGVTYITGNDCFIAHNRCVFCGRLPMGNPKTEFQSTVRCKRAWRELSQAQGYGIKRFYNSADSVGVDKSHLARFASLMPDGFEIEYHHMFFNAHEVTPDVIPSLKKLNASVYIGVENIALKKEAQKGAIDFERHDLKAIELLEKERIPMRLSFVLGLPGESDETMNTNVKGIVKLARDYEMIGDLELNPVEILPGTKLMTRLMESGRGGKFSLQQPPHDTLELSEAYAEEFCAISRSRTLEWIKQAYAQVRDFRPDLRVNTKGISQAEFEFLQS